MLFLIKYQSFFLHVLSILIISLIGFCFGYKSKKCPEIISGKTIIDTIFVPDTIIRNITDIKEVIKPVTKYVTKTDTIYKAKILYKDTDTVVCYSVEDTIKGASIKSEICSKMFPIDRPLDLSGTIEYVPPPEIYRLRIDTVSIKKPFFAKPENYIIAGLSGIICTGIYLQLKK